MAKGSEKNNFMRWQLGNGTGVRLLYCCSDASHPLASSWILSLVHASVTAPQQVTMVLDKQSSYSRPIMNN
jgi:hypothetical protein